MLAMFATIGMVGVIGASAMTLMKGPVRGMQEITKRTVAENNMIASGKLAIMGATNQAGGGDCDNDGYIEPVMFDDAGANPKPVGGGYLPSSIGASLQDPWQTRYGYCVWDHGSVSLNVACANAGVSNRLLGGAVDNQYTLVVISAGSDRIFQTGCHAWADTNTDNQPDTPLLSKVSGSDDIIYGYTYAEANTAGGGLWNLKSGEPNTAEIGAKDIEVKGSSGTDTAKIGFDADLGLSGVGKFTALKTDNIYSTTPGASVQMGSILRVHGVTGAAEPILGAGGGGSYYKTCAENDNCAGTPVLCYASAPDSTSMVSAATAAVPIVYGAWSNSQCGTSGTGWHAKISSCSSGTGTGFGKCLWVLVDQGSGGGGGGGGGGDSTPAGAIMAFDLATCPSGWSEYTAARGRFLRGIDSTGANDPDGVRSAGSLQADELKSHTHLTGQGGNGSTAAGAQFLRTDVGNTRATSATGGAETRPKNVAVLYCRKD